MISYDLIQKLEDAGFPFVRLSDGFCYRYPTTSELIAACGETFGGIYKNNDGMFVAVKKSEPNFLTRSEAIVSFLVSHCFTPHEDCGAIGKQAE